MSSKVVPLGLNQVGRDVLRPEGRRRGGEEERKGGGEGRGKSNKVGEWKRGETRGSPFSREYGDPGRVRGGEECLEEVEEREEVGRKDEEMQWRRRMKEREGRGVLLTGNHQRRRGHC